MQVIGISSDTFQSEVIGTLNATKYSNNPIVIEYIFPLSDNQFEVNLSMADPKGSGSRTSVFGELNSSCSWHTLFDIMAGVFYHNVKASVHTGAHTYYGKDDFYSKTLHASQATVLYGTSPRTWDDLSIDFDFDTNRFRWNSYHQGTGWKTFNTTTAD